MERRFRPDGTGLAALALMAVLYPAAAVPAAWAEEAAMKTKRERVVFLGDSLTAGHDWGRAFPGPTVFNLGLDGDTCAGVWGRLNRAANPRPDRLFLQIGINDFLRGAPPAEILAGHRRIWDELAARRPETRLYVISLLPYLESGPPGPPANLDLIRLNADLAAEAGRRGLTFINLFDDLADERGQLRPDLTTDGLHLNLRGYRIWAGRLQPYLETVRAEE